MTEPRLLVPVRTNTDEFAQYDACFSNTLVCLYELKYEQAVVDSTADGDSLPTLASLALSADWSTVPYFHGTTHCGCCMKRVRNSRNRAIEIDKWCTSKSCPTKGIVAHGFLRTKSLRGHFFSPNVSRAIKFAKRHLPAQKFLPILVCMARKVQTAPGQDDICWVDSDQDIIPRFLAIVQRQ